ncbi:MAG: STAS domain-containing protein [Candidatus Eisenbacteria bacterium]
MTQETPGHNKSTLRISVHEAGALVAVAVEGRLSVRNVEALTGRLARLFTSGKSAIIIDFSRLRHADYRGLPSLSSSLRKLSRCGCRVFLCNLSDYVLNIFVAAGCDEGLSIFERKEEAASALGHGLKESRASRSSRNPFVSTTM